MIWQEKRRLDGPYEKQVTESWDTEAPQRGPVTDNIGTVGKILLCDGRFG